MLAGENTDVDQALWRTEAPAASCRAARADAESCHHAGDTDDGVDPAGTENPARRAPGPTGRSWGEATHAWPGHFGARTRQVILRRRSPKEYMSASPPAPVRLF